VFISSFNTVLNKTRETNHLTTNTISLYLSQALIKNKTARLEKS